MPLPISVSFCASFTRMARRIDDVHCRRPTFSTFLACFRSSSSFSSAFKESRIFLVSLYLLLSSYSDRTSRHGQGRSFHTWR
ncbi:uncharacterized protein LAESUDRAFT_429017 [Laetiporus sulphureus 93-53]|uniref:Uncharacterized protein n=1 Tax=Laetiporus sulphureus 93-53 TaxID=1314785 RepID=A0A165GLW8_9APHY|nr:uncharacterized protein LAESUDRAFT_429017 [Laetiporus sulphureus 93-53]KZT10531.1 hypothetical protein LAESUDRAFT_429017 [Laetiporus sulphureus 93-53]